MFNTQQLLISLGIVLTTLLTSCSPRLSPFTQQLYRDNGWTEDDLQRIQFYLSEDVVLYRNLGRESSEIISGTIKMVDGKKVEQIVIPKKTPGVLVFRPRDDRFAVSFEDDDNKYLVFGPERELGGKYTLKAKRWEKRRGEVTYGGATFLTAAENAYAALMVDLRKIRDVSVKSRRAKGRTVN